MGQTGINRREKRDGVGPKVSIVGLGAKRPAALGRPDRVEVALRFTLSRAAMERLTARAIREGRSVEAVIAESLEGGKLASGTSTTAPPTPAVSGR